MSITGIDAVTFGVRSITNARRFLDDWGLSRVNAGKYGADYACADGSVVKMDEVWISCSEAPPEQ